MNRLTSGTDYPFYRSIRFRFGLIFGAVFLCFLMIVVFLLYTNVRNQFERSFSLRLATQADLILQKTEISPLVVPLPQQNEYFLLVYHASKTRDTLFNNLPFATGKAIKQSAVSSEWRLRKVTETLETGGRLEIFYVLPATELNDDVNRLRLVLFFYLPLAFLAAIVAGYFVSGFLVRPVRDIVARANNISLRDQINLLDIPRNHDELHELTMALNRMLTRLKKQSNEQNAFFASASHELRTPLSVMLTELQVLEMKDLPIEVTRIIGSQVAEVQRLSKLVNDFLLMSQLKSDTLKRNVTELNILEMVMDVTERLSYKSHLKQQTLKIDIEPADGDFNVFTDESLLKAILFNLLENAVKHSRAQTNIRLKICQEANGSSISIANETASDLSDLAELQNEFFKQDFQRDGFGLGLWIVKRLSELIGAGFTLSLLNGEFVAEVILKKDLRSENLADP